MAVYAVGDVQGCVVPLEEMLDKLRFDPQRDQLWLTGDLVNRGPHSLETLRLVKRLGGSAVTVLGNHDLHLLAVAAGLREARPGDTLDAILRAPDRDELLHWLRRRPLLHCDKRAELGCKTLLVHAGVYPGWSKKEAVARAAEVESLLRGDDGDDSINGDKRGGRGGRGGRGKNGGDGGGDGGGDYHRFLRAMYGRVPSQWRGDESPRPLDRWQRARFITNAFTRMRYCTAGRALDFAHAGPPGSQPPGLLPWFEHPRRKCRKWRVVFGHWSSLNFMPGGRVIGLDSGCIWGRALTAIRLDGDRDGQYWQVRCGGR
ncbi:MAG: symmetrical bis(5'-nucleosyl)-tetraphosphatase [Gammaproteobacteria bacterium]|nr:symmetrical bis(5'-nucleosyl)-tetraphosphatase [Gammaproteobacteria bacterium]